MIDRRAVACLVESAGAAPGVRIVEVGPGTGVLTRRLMAAGAVVLAVELDRGLAAWLEQDLVPQGLSLVHGDALAAKTRLHPAIEAFAQAGPWHLGANLPYDVALPILLNAAALPRPPQRMAATIQLEAAQRLVSRPGEDAWGATAAVLQAGGVPKLVRRLGPGSFCPPPRVDSAILTWTCERTLPNGFGTFVREAFAYRRKVLPGALRDAGYDREIAVSTLESTGIDASRRLEQLDAPELLALFAALPHKLPAAT